jgi:hypothetical protein
MVLLRLCAKLDTVSVADFCTPSTYVHPTPKLLPEDFANAVLNRTHAPIWACYFL